MNTRTSDILTAVALFSAGFVAGVLFAPKSGARLREDISNNARERVRWAEKHLKEVESKLDELEDSVSEKAKEISEKVKNAASVTPDLDEHFGVKEDEIARDLRHLTRK